ncbi:MAG: holo-[acyl-carrier-protein] synthase [Candidatus Omnitrophica bacterium CG11_big_fil_rev_8_21_14_0_20_45_26]|uniref:Holo-[acyl-carrier-protein] synthase n=1 Tax=Candidatus Abzuiibacterium crystallinum TaxID=1974748 RepID=A0A2H0LN50_9BACT|nr:MAG: holo-[acyl-carrier-protein] synthase [Candidatus Omnitrophica bacterium CG11_big_fil_rev_8_21_14_0_20_45_26]PIW65070.1 MAG: holo-[acyl-carrier-protein] synthase [Candidatus Omnitrophica bacterium CG12_big_fil_rev_8_21_14_0_65_45_16]
MSIPFEVGVDIVSVSRMRLAIERQGQRFLDRVFTTDEQIYCEAKRNKYENYAARFAAKEALIKAKGGGPGRYAFSAIEVKRGQYGKPYLFLSPRARKQLAVPAQAEFRLTMAHERDFAIATVMMAV